jgi:hypothetical protein
MDESAVIAGYDRLLASVGDRADDIGARPVVTHWPHVRAGLPEPGAIGCRDLRWCRA